MGRRGVGGVHGRWVREGCEVGWGLSGGGGGARSVGGIGGGKAPLRRCSWQHQTYLLTDLPSALSGFNENYASH